MFNCFIFVWYHFTFLFVSLVFSQGFGKNPQVFFSCFCWGPGTCFGQSPREVMKAVRASKSRTRPDKFDDPVTRIRHKPDLVEASSTGKHGKFPIGLMYGTIYIYIYTHLDLVDFYSTCRQIYHNYMDPMGLKHYHPCKRHFHPWKMVVKRDDPFGIWPIFRGELLVLGCFREVYFRPNS